MKEKFQPPIEPERYQQDISFCRTLEKEYHHNLAIRTPVNQTLQTIREMQAVRKVRESLERIVDESK